MSLEADVVVRLGVLELRAALRVESGETVAVVGPNGAGKSTLLRCLAGLLPIDEGSISVDGTVLDDPSLDVHVAPEHRPVGVVFQDHLLFPHLTALDNVAFGLRARGMSRREARAAALVWLERLGLGSCSSSLPAALSGGQAQRVALARALATQPRVLLLDEPLAALDASTRVAVRSELRRHLQSFDGMRVLVTHDPVDAHALADRIVVLEAGRVVQEGALSEVAASPRSRFVADLVGVNLVEGVVGGGVLVTAAGARVVIADAADGPTLAVIRPHSVVVSRRAEEGSARNRWAATIASIDRRGDRARLVLEGELPLLADITVDALEQLGLRPGDEVHAAVKATDIEVDQ